MECPEHPGRNTMVPCFGCGRYFCRVCEPLKGAGQYCGACYAEQLEKLSGEKRDAAPGAGGGPDKSGLKGRDAIRSKALAPFSRMRRWISRLGKGVRRSGAYAAGLPARAGTAAWKGALEAARLTRRRFPVGLAPRTLLEEEPPFSEAWFRLLCFVLGGAAAWIIGVAAVKARNPAISICVSVLVAAGAVWAMGGRNGVSTGIVAAGLAMVSLVLAELSVQLLYRAQFIVTTLDTQKVGLVSLQRPSGFYATFAFRLIVMRLLPAAIAALLIGWWPFKRRLSWVGFDGRREPAGER